MKKRRFSTARKAAGKTKNTVKHADEYIRNVPERYGLVIKHNVVICVLSFNVIFLKMPFFDVLIKALQQSAWSMLFPFK